MQKARRRTFHPCGWHSASTALRTYGFRFYFTPIPGFFSTFPHGTGSLSVAIEYLAFAHGRAGFTPGFSCQVLLGFLIDLDARFSPTGFSPSLIDLSRSFG